MNFGIQQEVVLHLKSYHSELKKQVLGIKIYSQNCRLLSVEKLKVGMQVFGGRWWEKFLKVNEQGIEIVESSIWWLE